MSFWTGGWRLAAHTLELEIQDLKKH